jgi:hypothetical protein
MELLDKYRDLEKRFITKTANRDQLLGIRDELNFKIISIDIENLEKANILLQKLSEKQRKTACQKLQELCTYALQYSLGPNYEMQIEMSKERGKPAADIYVLKKDTGTRTSPLDANGGGVVDIVSNAIRLVTMQVYEPFIDGPIFLDEPYKMVSKEFIPMVAELIAKMSADFGRQIIISTHNDFLAQTCNQIYVSMGENNESKVVNYKAE